MRIIDHIDHMVRVLSAIFLAVMTSLVLIQVFWRYALNSPLGEPLELSVTCMVWATMLGTATVVRKKSHIAVTMLVDVMPSSLRKVSIFFSYGVMLVIFYLIATHGWTVMLKGMRQISSITGMPQGYVALSIPVGGALSILYILELIWKELRGIEQLRSTEEIPDA